MERHFQFEVDGATLVATLHQPDDGQCKPLGLVLLHGWAGYRIGAHQMFVKLGRRACEHGFACLRFDFRGRGDSEGDMSSGTLSTMIRDARVAAELLLADTPVERIALIGDCSGSEVAIGAGPLIEECTHLALWSAPIVGASRETADEAKRKHIFRQYLGKLLRRETWQKLIGGRLQIGMIKKALLGGGKGAGEQGSESDQDIDWLGRFTGFGGEVLFIYGSKDPTTEAALEHYQGLTKEARREWRHHLIDGANHAFYSVQWEREVIETTLDWLQQ